MPRDLALAASWNRKAADQDIPLAMYNVGSMYYRGEGVVRDDREAAKWFRKAAEKVRC
ncbi:hypothetical protein LP419_20360 [Massilia sp. H-1]|nr:hypothetical protein LP419_20360 [Massilia sp. H-1]